GFAGTNIAGVYIDTDTYPDEVFENSNEINSLIMVQPFSFPEIYLSTLAHEFQHMVQANMDDSEESWVVEGIAELGSLLALPEYFDTSFQQYFLSGFTQNQLNAWPYQESSLPYYGAASLFFSYLVQRYGEAWIPY